MCDDFVFLPKNAVPGMPEEKAMLRVDLAGEQSAVAIYKGQLSVLAENKALRPCLEEMLAHEQAHKTTLERWVCQEKVRPSLFTFFWIKMAYSLGVLAGRLGPDYAMAQTEAVESVIEKHYGEQVRSLEPGPLQDLFKQFQEEEQHHQHQGQAFHQGGVKLELWMWATTLWTKAAVWIATRA